MRQKTMLFFSNQIWYWRRRAARKIKHQLNHAQSEEVETSADSPPAAKKKRLRSLDAFRGLSIVVMIFVNYGGGSYWFFNHSAWNGLTIADLVFPWFMFIMGTSLGLSQKRREKISKLEQFWQISRRSAILFGLGIFVISQEDDFKTLRIMGVLQRFGMSYFAVAFFELAICEFSPLVQSLFELGFSAAIITIHTCLTFLLRVPGCPRGYLGPGGWSENSSYVNCTGGAAGYIDWLILGSNHVYQYPTPQTLYNTTVPYDPEGLLGVLTSIIIVILGLQAGKIFSKFSLKKPRLISLGVWAFTTGLAGGILCKFSKNDGWIPVNKNLWSLSFIFVLASMAFALLSVFYVIIDELHWWNGSPFYQAGMNSILLYCGHEILQLPFQWEPLADTHAANLAQDVWGVFLWVVIAIYLHWKRQYFTV